MYTEDRYLKSKQYELKDHLGNVRVVLSDYKITTRTDTLRPYCATVLSAYNYYPFGMLQQGMYSEVNNTYRFGFNGMMRLDKVMDLVNTSPTPNEGVGNALDFGARLYNPRTARWNSPDQNAADYPSLSSYVAFGDNPVIFIDPDGKDLKLVGKGNSSITFKTNLIDFTVDVRSLGINFGGNYTLSGEDILSAALDIGGIFDPTGTLDAINAGLQANNGDYLSAGISGLGLIPYAGDLAKAGKIKKDLEIIEKGVDALKTVVKGGDEVAETAVKVEKKVIEGVYEFKDAKIELPYIGESQDIYTRLKQHIYKGKVTPEEAKKANILEVPGGKKAREIEETKQINKKGGKKNGTANKKNPVKESDWKKYNISKPDKKGG